MSIQLTVREGQARSDIIFCDSCMKVTSKDSVDWETQWSHIHRPHSSSGPGANSQCLPLRFLRNSWRASFIKPCLFSPSFSLPAAIGSLRIYALLWSALLGLLKMILDWNVWPQNKTEGLQWPASISPQSAGTEICEDKGTFLLESYLWNN